MRLVVVLALGCVACATTASVCPIGTKLSGARPPNGHAQWCTSTNTTIASLPGERSFDGVLGVAEPIKMAGGVEGPFTSWHRDGAVASHGHYVDFGARSVPEGIWGFWYPSGQRRMLGAYKRGLPDGCFAVWNETGTRSTGFVEGEQLRVETCTPPSDDELLIVEGRGHAEAVSPRWGDVTLQGFVGPNGIGARNREQIETDPVLRVGLNLTARKRVGRIRFGPTVAFRASDNTEYRGLAAGGVVAFALPTLHPRLDADASLELGAQYITATAIRPMQPGTADLAFWAPLGAAQLSLGVALSPNLEALVAARVDGTPTKDTERQTLYCEFGNCIGPLDETWQIGGFSYGLTLGLRLVIR